MLKFYVFTYSDGVEIIRAFETEDELNWFSHNEGDHLIKVRDLWPEKMVSEELK